MMDLTETRYAKSGEVHLAYQIVGDGPPDLVFVPGFASHVELQWEEPNQAHFFNRLASFSRLIRFDKRGTGLSDRVIGTVALEERMDDLRAVMDAAECERAVLLALSEGGPLSMVFAATYPERTSALVLWNTFARLLRDVDYDFGVAPETREQMLASISQAWGDGTFVGMFAPSAAADPAFSQWWARFERHSISPGAVADVMGIVTAFDARAVLASIHVPTLVMRTTNDLLVPAEVARFPAEHISGARLVEVPGGDHFPWFDGDVYADEIEEFITGVRRGPEPNRVLATVLFTDIVGSTEHAAAMGDRRWKELLDRHHSAVRRELDRFQGREIATAGDGFLASFDSPARALRCARAIADHLRSLGIDIRAGVHTGECELMGDNLSGIALHIGSRIAGLAGPGELLVSSTVKDLVAGSGIEFADRGTHSLKGVRDDWRLYQVVRT
jgi:pimeloyl-ACP methyl ester carboxylesterase